MNKDISVLRQASTLALPSVMHVGTLNPSDKRGDSHEGNGLSVSLHPEEWTAIAKLGGGSLYELTKPDGRFLDFHRLSRQALDELQAWGLRDGWLQMAARWRCEWFDDELSQTVFMLCKSLAEAQAEADDREDSRVEEVVVPELTVEGIRRLGFKLEAAHALDIAATFWVEDETDLDGVWWDDLLEPQNYSAPRGVICLRRLSDWHIEYLRGPRTR